MKYDHNVLYLDPIDFDDHFFNSDWRPRTHGFYKKFHLERIEIYRNHLSLPLPPHRRSVHYFVFLTKGSVVRSKGLSLYEIKEGQIFFLSARQISTIEKISEDAQGYYCHFQPDIFIQPKINIDLETAFPFFSLTGSPIVDVKNNNRILHLCKILEKEYILSKENRFDLISIYLLALFTEIQCTNNILEGKTKNAAYYLTNRYKNALSEFIYEKKKVADYAEYLTVSINHLNKSVKTTTGKSAQHLLTEMRILESKVLLRQTNLSIGEIAYRIGGYETSDFSRLFKKNTNLTPNQYRNFKN